MDPGSITSLVEDETLPQRRGLPQLPSLIIAPLRSPGSSRGLNVPSPVEPKADAHENAIPRTSSGSGALPAKLPTLEEFLTAARTNIRADSSISSVEPPPKTILPAFINPRAVEKLPYSPFDEEAPHKRRRIDVPAEHFGEHLQLPIPHAQSEKPPPFGPLAILNGLNEPPPNAALLPPIEPGSIPQILTKPSKDAPEGDADSISIEKGLEKPPGERREGRLEEILDSPSDDQNQGTNQDAVSGKCQGADDTANGNGSSSLTVGNSKKTSIEDAQTPTEADSDEPMSPKTRGRSRRNVRKWTEGETNDLLKGVVKCGIGNWTAILSQPELKFNKRTAANLRDRFRVCCPWAYGSALSNEAKKPPHNTLSNALMNAETTDSSSVGKILLPDPRPVKPVTESGSAVAESTINPTVDAPSRTGPAATETTTATKLDPDELNRRAKLSPTVRSEPTSSERSKSTLDSMGFEEPYFTKSTRRCRRAFTAAEDEAILKGYAVHGFQWSLIQQDRRLNLYHRKPTDLRDRFRTRFPNSYREGGSVSGKTVEDQRDLDLSVEGSARTPSVQGKENPPSQQQPLLPDVTSPTPSTNRKQAKPAVESTPSGFTSTAIQSAPTPGPMDLSAVLDNGGGGSFQFPLDESSTAGNHVDAASWEDSPLPPLPPMSWDELD